MRVVCIHIPKSSYSPGSAIYATKWDLFNHKYFLHQLDELAESIWEPFSLELLASGRTVYFCMAGSEEIVDILVTGVYSWMGDSQILDIDDYTELAGPNSIALGADMRLTMPDIYPTEDYLTIRTDSIIPILNPLKQIPEGDNALVQLIVRPIKESIFHQISLQASRLSTAARDKLNLNQWLKKDLSLNVAEKIQLKCASHLFWSNCRVSAFSNPAPGASAEEKKAIRARLNGHIESISAAIKSYGKLDYNRYTLGSIKDGAPAIRNMRERRFIRPFRLSSMEIATIYHPPTLGEIANTAQVLSRKAPAPPELPTAKYDPTIGNFAHTNYRDHEIEFGLTRADRRRHLYIIGKSGSGKSCLMQLLVRDDIERGYGCAVLDPHGDLIDDILRLIPQHRINDVVLFDPGNPNFAPSFNPLAPIRPDLKLRVAMSFLDSFKRVFGADWSDRMDHVLRYAVLGLVNVPGCNLLSLRKMLSDEKYRGEIIRQARDESVKRFWLREFTAHRRDFEEGPISRILNRLDELLATDSMRQILGQPGNLFNFREFMDSRKIVLIKISKGILGSENASLLGSMLVWKIYEAAMSRADIPAENREDFYLYVDEFQNFATESFGEILSEARKYNLSLTFANQYLSQLPTSIRKTIFGNIANLLSFRVGADDAAAVASELSPAFDDGDIVNLAIRDFYIRMSINGQVQSPFSGHTVDIEYPQPGQDFAAQCVEAALKRYCTPVQRLNNAQLAS